jgi:hypothetical protein
MSEETGQHHLTAYGAIRETHRYLSLEEVQNHPRGTVLPFAVLLVEEGVGETGIEAEVEDSCPTATATVTVIASHSGHEADQGKAGEIGSGIVTEPVMQKLTEENASKDEIWTGASNETRKRETWVCGDEIDPQGEIVSAPVGHHRCRLTLGRRKMPTLARPA